MIAQVLNKSFSFQGLVTEPHTILANVIFLGDHKQLGPIIESSQAKKLGLAESLMERLMKLPKYSEPFNPRFVTQLLNNFRSHEAILHFSNFQFYDGKLRPMADPKEVDFAVGWNLLPNKEFPLILHSVVNPCSREKNSYSWVNLEEVSVVLSYVDELLKNGINGKKISQTDIGIVTPYKAQLARLKTAFTARPGIEIGTSEYYQGREKNIMIISTVKSGGNIGFLKDPRRLNVALTRARSLMILVCNPTTMQKDEMWHSFIEFLIKNNAIVGEICAELKVVDEIVESFDDSFDDEEEMEGAVCP